MSTVLHPQEDNLIGITQMSKQEGVQTSRLITPVGLAIMAIIYLLLAVTTTQILHFSRTHDEGYHLELITFVKQNGRLPVTFEERAQMARADLPFLYHLLVAVATPNVSVENGPTFKYFYDSFRYQAVDTQHDHPWSLDTEDLQPPYRGRFLVWQIGRWLSVGLSLITVLLVFCTLQEIPLGQRPLTSLFGAALLAFIPRYLILGASLNDDSLLGLLAALYFWMLVKLVKSPARWWPLLGLGLALGLANTVKYSLVLLPFEIAVVFGLLVYRQRLGWRWLAGRLVTVGLLAALASSWWFGWNIWHFNTIEQDGLVVGVTRSLFSGGYNTTLNQIGDVLANGELENATISQSTESVPLSRWVTVTLMSFWGYQINNQIPWVVYAYSIIGLLLVLAGIGLVRLWRKQPESRLWILLAVFHLLLLIIIPWLRFETSGRIGQTAQGRHILIPAAAAVIALLVWGLTAAIPQRWRLPVFSIIIAGFVSWTGAHLYQLTAVAAPPPLPLRSMPQAAEWLSQPVNAKFDEAVELVSYDAQPAPEQGVLHLNLAWRSLGYVNESYRFQVEMLNSNGNVVSHWVGYNGHGRLPTLAWDPGDSVFDRLVLPLPNAPAGSYLVRVQLLGREGPLEVSRHTQQQDEPAQSNALLLSPISLDDRATLTLPHQARLAAQNPITIQFGLWQADGPVGGEQKPVYRYPATIAVVTSHNGDGESTLTVQLVDEAGQVWPATQNKAGIYTFVVGPRWQSSQYRVQMALEQGGAVVAQTTTGPLLTVENWWKRQFEVPDNIAEPLEANFANQIKLLGYKLPQKQVKAGDAFPITFYWQAPPNMSPQANFIQFNHLLDGNGTLRGGYDRRPLEYYSTLLWAPGEVVVDGYAVPVDADAPPGEYWLDVGYYLTVGQSAVNLPLVVDGELTDTHSVTVGPIEVLTP